MKHIIRFTVGFVAMIIIAALCLFAICAFAQERFLPSIAGIDVVPTYQNASLHDGISATMISPIGVEQVLYFDLGYWLPANTPIIVNIYSSIPPGSNLLLAALIDEPIENAHQWESNVVYERGDPSMFDSSNEYSQRFICPFAVRHLCLIRHRETLTNNIILLSGIFVPATWRKENGMDVTVDALSVGEKIQSISPRTWRMQYGHVTIANTAQGKTLK